MRQRSKSRTWLIGIGTLATSTVATSAMAYDKPLAPQATVDVTYPTPNGTTCNASNDAELATCLTTAAAANPNLNHEIVLAAGKTFSYVQLPGRAAGTGWVTLRSSNLASLPAFEPRKATCRVSPTDAPKMAKIQMDGRAAGGGHNGVTTSAGAHHYRLAGIEIAGAPAASSGSWFGVFLGADLNGFPAPNIHHFVIERSYIHGDPNADMREGIRGDADQGYVGAVCNYISEIHEDGADSQAFIVIATPGPVLVENNYLESAGENWMCGGAVAGSAALVPKDIYVVRNTLQKQTKWLTVGKPGGGLWTRKTALETKDCRRVVIEGNLFQDWFGEGGHAMRLTPRNENGTGPYTEVSDLEIRFNTFRRGMNWLNAFGSDDGAGCGGACTSMQSQRWWIHDNLVYDLGKNGLGGESNGSLMTWATGGAAGFLNFSYTHNTALGTCERVFATAGQNHTNVDYSNNLQAFGCADASFARVVGDWLGTNTYGTTQLDRAITNWTYAGNTLFDYSSSFEMQSQYPATTVFDPAGAAAIGMVNPAAGDFHLKPGSPYSATGTSPASDGKDRGVEWDLFDAAQLDSPIPPPSGTDPAGPGSGPNGSADPNAPNANGAGASDNGSDGCHVSRTRATSTPFLLCGIAWVLLRRRRPRSQGR